MHGRGRATPVRVSTAGQKRAKERREPAGTATLGGAEPGRKPRPNCRGRTAGRGEQSWREASAGRTAGGEVPCPAGAQGGGGV